MSNQHPREEIAVFISASDWQLSNGEYQAALLGALGQHTKSQWRMVCANILVECSEPYRTVVLCREVLETLRTYQALFGAQTQNENAAWIFPEIFQVKAEMHTPLIEDVRANIMFKRAAAFLSAA